MIIAMQILRLLGIVWLAIVFGKTVGSIDGTSAVIGFWAAMSRFDWLWLTIHLILAIALIWGTTRLIDKRS